MRTVSVQATGVANAKADRIQVFIYNNSRHENYETAMQIAEQNISSLQNSMLAIGFAKEDLKTTSFHVNTEYEDIQDERNQYRRVFKGYIVNHHLEISFDFNMELLGNLLEAILNSQVKPELNIQFSVHDKQALRAEALKNASAKARVEAQVLCEASGVQLGDLQNMQYAQASIGAISRTQFSVPEEMAFKRAAMVDITPQDVELSEDIIFVWEIR